MEVDRSAHFAPVKNANGAKADTPATAKAALLGLHKRWPQPEACHTFPWVHNDVLNNLLSFKRLQAFPD